MTGTAFLLSLLLGSATPAAPAPDTASLNAENLRVLLNHYPPRARRAGEQGPVGFKVALDHDGYANSCEVTRSSGHPRLDEETCRLIMDHAIFRAVGDARNANAIVEGTLNWTLSGKAAAQASQTATASATATEKIICRRQLRTGSLADFQRLCATQSDWRRMGERTREEWGELQGAKGSTHGD